MKPVKQTICNFQTGNCVQACVASMFELPLKEVPNFMMGGTDHFLTHLRKWCDGLGIVALDVSFEYYSEAEDFLKDCYVIAIGKSPRITPEVTKKILHAVVWFNGKIVHNPYPHPHPSGKDLDGDPDFFTVFILKDPSKLKERH